jgi:hypothetical protein
MATPPGAAAQFGSNFCTAEVAISLPGFLPNSAACASQDVNAAPSVGLLTTIGWIADL